MITGIGTGNGVGLIRGLFPSTASAFENSKSVYFDGVNDYISLTPPAALQLDWHSNRYTVSFWLKHVSGSGFGYLGTSPNSVTKGWGFTKSGGFFDFHASAGGGDRVFFRADNASTQIILDGDWHYIALTMTTAGDISTARFVVDGTQYPAISTINDLSASTSNANDWECGRVYGGSTYGEFYMDELSIFSGSLSLADMQAQYNMGCPADLSSYSPISWWRFEDDYTDEEGVQDFTATGASISSDIPC